MAGMLEARRIHLTLDGHGILNGVDLRVDPGEFIGVIGPNGSGKSTLLRCLTKILHPSRGEVLLGGARLDQLPHRRVARRMAVVAQENPASFDYSVHEVVAMARFARKRLLQNLDQRDLEVIAQALAEVGMTDLARQSFLRLSGGEKQRTLIARALAQQTDLIVLDEPTNHLDIRSQLETLELLRRSGKTVLCALHDLATAIHYCDRIYVLKAGRVVAQGPPREVVAETLIAQVYGVRAEVFDHGGRLFIDFLTARSRAIPEPVEAIPELGLPRGCRGVEGSLRGSAPDPERT
ncbi:MAG: ABC transporter ATP-binding protein [Propionicimonas sp.]